MLAFDHLLKKEQQEKQQKLQKQQNQIQQNVISNNVGLVQVGSNAVSTSASSNTSNSNSISTSNTSAISSALNIQGVGAGRVDVTSTVGSITVNNVSNNENNNGINAPYSTVTDSQQNQIVSAIQVKYQDIAYYLSLLEHEIARHQELGDKQREEEKSIATLEEKQAKKNQEQLDKQYIDAKNDLKTEREKNVNQAATRLASAMSSTQSVAQSLEDGNRDVPLYTSIPNSSHNIAIQTGPVGPVVGQNGEVLLDTSNQAKELIKNNISNQQDNQWLGKVGTGEVGPQNVSIDVNVNANAGVQATTQGQFGSHDVAPQNVQVTNPTSPTLQPNNQQRVAKSNDHFVNQQGVMYRNTSNQGVQQIGVNSVDTRGVRTNGAYTNNTNNSNNQITGNRGYQDTQGGIPFDDVPFPIEQMVNTQGASRQFASTNGSSLNGASKQYVGGANTTSSNVGGYDEYDSGYSDVADIASGGGDYIAPTSFSEESDNESDLENSYTYTDRNISAELGNWALHNNVVKPSNEVVISNKRILDESDFIGLIDDSYLKDVFKANVDKSYHTMLVKGERLETSDENTWNLRVPNEFKFWIDEKNICKVEEAVSKGLGRTIKINIDFVEDSNLSRCPSSLISSYFNHRLKLKKQELQSNQTFSVIANKMRINLDNSYYCFTEARELKN